MSTNQDVYRLKDKKDVKGLIRLLRDKDHIIRCNAAAALGVLGYGRAAKPLLNLLKDKDPYVRATAAEALPNLRGSEAVKPLLAALKDKDSWLRNIAIDTLGHQSDLKVVEVLR